MGTTGYETRTTLLLEAKAMLYENWHGAREQAMWVAQAENRAPTFDLPPPSIEQIVALAEKMNAFVCTK